MESKFAIRKKFLQIRREIKKSYRQTAGLQAASHFINIPFLQQNMAVACYLPTQYEFDSSPIIEAIWKINCYCYLPVVIADDKLQFVRYHYGDKLRKNQFSILEPIASQHIIAPEKLDMVITPLVAFDRDGHRLGSGGGYYDRTFSFLHEAYISKPFFLGLAFAVQRADSLPYDPWDINLDGIVTEHGFTRPFM